MKTLRSLLIAFAILFGSFAAGSFVDPTPAYAQATAPDTGSSTSSSFGNTVAGWFGVDLSNPKTYDQYYQEDSQWLNSSNSTTGLTQCWGCEIFSDFVGSLMTMGQTSSNQLDGPMLSIMIAFASVFSLFYLGGSFVAGDASDLASRWKVFWRLCLAVAVGGAWLNNHSFANTWNYVYGPIMSVPIAIEQGVVAQVGGPSGNCGTTVASPTGLPDGATKSVAAMGQVVCGAHQLTIDNIAKGMAIFESGDGLGDKIVHWAAGGFVIVIFFWLMISFPLRFIDVLIRLSIVGIVTPVMVVCAVFKPTRGYCLVAVNNVLNAACQFAFTGIMFALGQKFFTDVVNKYSSSFSSASEMTVVMSCAVICACALLFGSMVKMAPGIASEFSQFSASAGGVGAAAEGIARAPASLAASAGGAAAGGAIGAVGGAVGTSMALARSGLGKRVTSNNDATGGGG